MVASDRAQRTLDGGVVEGYYGGGRWGRGKSPPPPRRRVRARPRYTFVHTRRRTGRVCHRRRLCGSSVQSTRQNGYSLLYDTHSVLSVRFLLIAVFVFFRFFYDFSLLRISWFRVIPLLFFPRVIRSRLQVNGNESEVTAVPGAHYNSLVVIIQRNRTRGD